MPRDPYEIPIPGGCPKHLIDRPDKLYILQREANGLAGLLGADVYLCGSALRDDNPDPRDWDIRVILPNEHFEVRYGPIGDWNHEGCTGQWQRTRWRWSDDCTKLSRQWRERTNMNIDVQIYHESHVVQYRDKPRMRLDTRWNSDERPSIPQIPDEASQSPRPQAAVELLADAAIA